MSRLLTPLLLLVCSLLAAAPADAAPLTFEVERKGERACTSSHELRLLNGTCQTKDLAVRFPGGPVPVRLDVASVRGCPEIPVLVRTRPIGSGRAGYSFSDLTGAAGSRTSEQLTRVLGDGAETFQAPKGRLYLHVEAPYRACDGLGSFKVKVTFPTLGASATGGRCARARSALRSARRAKRSANRAVRRAEGSPAKRSARTKARKAAGRVKAARRAARRRC